MTRTKRALEATFILLQAILFTALVAAVAYYAANHPWFAIHILCPVLGLALIAALWCAIYISIGD